MSLVFPLSAPRLLALITLTSLLSAVLAQNYPSATASATPNPTSSIFTANNSSSSSSNNSYLFFIALGLGVVFINVWFVLGMKYFLRRRRHQQMISNNGSESSGINAGNGDDMYQLNSPYGNVNPSAARQARQARRRRQVLTLDQLNEKFPVVSYKSWREERHSEGQSTAGGISQAQQINLFESASRPTSRPISRSTSPSGRPLSRPLSLPVSRSTSLRVSIQKPSNADDNRLILSTSPVTTINNSLTTPTNDDTKTKNHDIPLVTTTTITDLNHPDSDNNETGDISSARPPLHERLSYLLSQTRRPWSIKDSESEIENGHSLDGENTLSSPRFDYAQCHNHDELQHDELDNIELDNVDLGDPGDICAVCLEDLEDDDSIRALTCGHVFHSHCITLWMTDRRACCPLCKKDYSDYGNINTVRPNDLPTNPFHSRNAALPIYNSGWHFARPATWTTMAMDHLEGSRRNLSGTNQAMTSSSAHPGPINNTSGSGNNNRETGQESGVRSGGLAHFFRKNDIRASHPQSN
ncbi:hypothetical protein NADFUDRAFT_52967 [Nadsonia fulvescens var. elongata DSM 6958]|uniref:RING-type domain-containing protein n=1 Tax=Nadsonia fulvescens var. elongata DSM 6958 TaxID=857566 RepID=A0A1E3PGC8_9ASCO|nr:hypothetical protein NADFUDRAFT_52967 [Nadsonia fulvescens var. elongata DSM 6958]